MSAGGGRAVSRGRMIDARAYWAVAPGVGEIRTERIPPPSTGEVLVRALWSGVSRGTGPWSAGSRAGQPVGRDAGALSGGRFSVSREVRLQQRRRRRGRACRAGRRFRILFAPTSDPLCRPGVRGGAATARATTAARGARREHGDGAQRRLGRRGGARAAHPCHRSRCGRRHDRLCLRSAPRRRGDARGHRPRPVRASRGAWSGIRGARRPGWGRRSGPACERQSGGPAHRPGGRPGSRRVSSRSSWYGSAEVSLPLGEAFHSRRLALIALRSGRSPRRCGRAGRTLAGSPRHWSCCAIPRSTASSLCRGRVRRAADRCCHGWPPSPAVRYACASPIHPPEPPRNPLHVQRRCPRPCDDRPQLPG